MIPKRIAQRIAQFLLDKKAEDVMIMNLRKVTDMTYYFVVCTANSATHSKALARELEEKMGVPWHLEGYSHGHWILLDYIDVVAHVFLKDTREYYGLETLWGDVPTEKME
ncbi:ribosome silencing factor [candidate division WOR-3 bacterium]|nr:ribosome silencing factor [candidate division WOR-3 bacterium]